MYTMNVPLAIFREEAMSATNICLRSHNMQFCSELDLTLQFFNMIDTFQDLTNIFNEYVYKLNMIMH